MSKSEKNDKTEIIDEPMKLQFIHEMELEMMSDLYSRMTSVCHVKCIPPHYREAELRKGEKVCIDRCVAKYLEIHGRIGQMLATLSMQEDEQKAK